MASLIDENFNCEKTANAPNELTWLENGQVVANLKDGSVLAIAKMPSGEFVWTKQPGGDTPGPNAKAWPHPTGEKPPKFLAYYFDDGDQGKARGYQP